MQSGIRGAKDKVGVYYGRLESGGIAGLRRRMGGETAEHGDICHRRRPSRHCLEGIRRATRHAALTSVVRSRRHVLGTRDRRHGRRVRPAATCSCTKKGFTFSGTRAASRCGLSRLAMTSTRFARVLLALMLTAVMSAAVAADMRAFDADSMQAIRTAHGGRPFVLAFWSVHCAPCLGDMADWRELRRRHPRGADPSRGDGSAFGTCTRGSGRSPVIHRAASKPGHSLMISPSASASRSIRPGAVNCRGPISTMVRTRRKSSPGRLDRGWAEAWFARLR